MSEIVLDLKKTFELNLTKAGILDVPILRTRAAIDRSGSMRDEFASGYVQSAVDLFIGAALKFDDNGELEIGFFNHQFTETPVAVASDVGSYLRTKGRGIDAEGGTSFAPVIEWMTGTEPGDSEDEPKSFFGGLKSVLGFGKSKQEQASECGQYLGLITDGSLEISQARAQFEDSLADLDPINDFVQLIGIGTSVDEDYLQDIANRYPNIEFVHFTNPNDVTPDAFYARLCNQKFAAWVAAYNKAHA